MTAQNSDDGTVRVEYPNGHTTTVPTAERAWMPSLVHSGVGVRYWRWQDRSWSTMPSAGIVNCYYTVHTWTGAGWVLVASIAVDPHREYEAVEIAARILGPASPTTH